MSIRRWLFETPQFKDEDKNRSAQLLHIILLAYLASTSTFLVILPLMTPDLIERALFVIAFIPLFMMLFWMMRRGYIRLAAFILLAFNWTILVMMSLGASGVHDPSYASQILLILFAGFLLGPGAAAGLTIIDLVLGLGMIAAQNAGYIMPIAYPSFAIWYSQGTLFVGAVILIFVIIRHLDGALRRARIEIEQREKIEAQQEILAAKEEFVSIVSHEFKTPLAVIVSSVELLMHYHERLTPDKRQERLATIHQQCDHMNEMLNQILSIRQAARLESQMEQVDLVNFCQAMIDHTRMSSQDHAITLNAVHSIGCTYVDTQRLRHILGNLLSNAVKYSPGGETVDMQITRTGSNIVLEVRDHGIGIPPQSLDRIFTPFHRADNAHDFDGTGLGLAIVKEHVDAMGGTITCESVVNEGTTFRVVLPQS